MKLVSDTTNVEWTSVPDEDVAYTNVLGFGDYATAKAKCQEEGGQLPEFYSQSELDLFRAYW